MTTDTDYRLRTTDDRYHNLPSRLTRSEISKRVRNVLQLVLAIDHGREFAGIGKIRERHQVVALRFRDVEDPPGARQPRSERSLEQSRDHCPESGGRAH